jgi:DNA-binding protein HU-beta
MALKLALKNYRWYKMHNRSKCVLIRHRQIRFYCTAKDLVYKNDASDTRTGSKLMNKTEFVAAVAEAAELSKTDAANAVDAMIEVVKNALKNGDTITLVGFGTFSVRKRAARQGRNPQTGATIKIKASKNPAFKAGKALKDAVN